MMLFAYGKADGGCATNRFAMWGKARGCEAWGQYRKGGQVQGVEMKWCHCLNDAGR